MSVLELIPEEGDVIDETHKQWLQEQPPEYMELRQKLLSKPKAREMCLIIEYCKMTMGPAEYEAWVTQLEERLGERLVTRKAEQEAGGRP